MTLASQGLLSFPAAMALVLGENIGTTITAQLARIGATNINAHRTANAHTIFNIIGVIFMLMVFPGFIKLIIWITAQIGTGPVDAIVEGESVNIARYIANGHTLFNVINAVIFLILMPLLLKAAIWISPKDRVADDTFNLPNFDDRLIDSPIAALAKARGEIIRMAEQAAHTFHNTLECLEKKDYQRLATGNTSKIF